MITKELILNTVCEYYGLNHKILLTKNRKAEYVNARQVYYYFCRNYTVESLNSMAKLLNQDHSTAVHSVKVIDNLISLYSKTKNEITFIDYMLQHRKYEFISLVPVNLDLLTLTENYTNSFIR